MDHLLSETTSQGTVSYTYDHAGRRTSLTVAGQPTGSYTYRFSQLYYPTALFVWMSRFVATAFPLTLSLSRKGRGNPRTASSYKCKPL